MGLLFITISTFLPSGAGANANGARPHKFRGVRDDIIGRIARNFVAVNGHSSQAPVATAAVGVRLVMGISGEVPFEHVSAPVAGSADDQIADMKCQGPLEVIRRAGPLFGEINVFVRMRLMNRRQHVNQASV